MSATKIIINGNVCELSGGGGASTADKVSYDNTDSWLESENVQDAIDELSKSDCGEIYSTDETRIGTWIDGKPLYRMAAYVASKTIKGKTWTSIFPAIKNAIPINFYVCDTSLDGSYYMLTYPGSFDERAAAQYHTSYGVRVIFPVDVTMDFTVVIEYVKSTDKATMKSQQESIKESLDMIQSKTESVGSSANYSI